MKGLYDMAFHNHWLNVIRKMKGVKSVMHIRTATKPPKFLLHTVLNNGNGREVINYRLDEEPSTNMEDEYLFIINDLKKKGYGEQPKN
jgi:hypothetical protein